MIKTYDELDHWLGENNYFEDGYILQVDLDPLVITVGYLTEGNYKANTAKSILSFKITPSNLVKWNYSADDFPPSEDDTLENIEPMKVDKGIALEFLAFHSFQLIAESLTISDPVIIESTFKPWLSNRNIFAKAPMKSIPKPNFWKEKLQDLGHDILFRYFAGEGKQPEQIPYPDYSGYFIQLADQVKDTEMGILIESLSIKNGVISIHFSNHDEHLENVWICLTSILADLPYVQISCGNCEFTGEEWKQLPQNKG